MGARQVAENCLKVQPGETVVIITDEKQMEVGKAIQLAAATAGGEVIFFSMENFGTRPDEPSEETLAMAFPDEIRNAMESAQVSVYCASGKKGELESFRRPMIGVVMEKKIRHGHMPGISKEVMCEAMCADYTQVQALGAKVYAIANDAVSAHLTTPGGTDLTVKFHPDWKWLVDNGEILGGELANLPGGEDFTCAENGNGVIVVDGFIGDHFDQSVVDNPITIKVKDGRITSVKCPENLELEAELLSYFLTDENSNRLSEFAIGTNLAVAIGKNIGELMDRPLLQMEKSPTVHVAFGDGFKDETGCTWESKTHLDCIVLEPTLVLTYADGSTFTVFEDGNYNPELLAA